MTDKLEKVARAICPKVKPWMDDPDIRQSGVCDCERNVETNYGPGQTACWMTMNDIAKAAIAAHEKALEAEGLVIVPREPTQEMRRAGAGRPMCGDPEEVAHYKYKAMLAALEGKE